jgi:glycine/D-amino acid oxidase-like deaminating enzyme
LQRAQGVEVALLDQAELATRFPWLNTEDLVAGSLGLEGEGWLDGYALLRAFRRAAGANGATFRTAEAAAIRTLRGAVRGVVLADGTEIACDGVVNAAGPWSARVAAMAGLSLPVHAKRRSVFVIATPDPLPGCPLIIDPSGFWVRPEGDGFITGAPPAAADDLDDLPLVPDHALFEETIWPALAHRIPSLERLRVRSAWAGYYEVNSFDHNGIVGAHPALEGFYLATGFSGHGLQQAPAVGRGLAELIATGRYRTLDLAPLGMERLIEGRPLLERNVI